MRSRRRGSREKDLTGRYHAGNLDEERVEAVHRFSSRGKRSQQEKIVRTALLRAQEQPGEDVDRLPRGRVIQVYSLYSVVEEASATYLCVVRKTLNKISDTAVVVGDEVRFRPVAADDAKTGAAEDVAPQGVIEQVLPRRSVLSRSDSFKGLEQHPIVANAEQMLIVASLRLPDVKWGLVDRMVIAAEGGNLRPIICLNKIDLAPDDSESRDALAHYASLGFTTLQTSVEAGRGLDSLRDFLRDQTTVLAGHSGVGKSSLIRAIQPHLDLRIGEISKYTAKGRHTTTSARRYPLDFGGAVIDTPGVKLFGLWGVTRDNLEEFFPDMKAGTAPSWRQESYQRIRDSLLE